MRCEEYSARFPSFGDGGRGLQPGTPEDSRGWKWGGYTVSLASTPAHPATPLLSPGGSAGHPTYRTAGREDVHVVLSLFVGVRYSSGRDPTHTGLSV